MYDTQRLIIRKFEPQDLDPLNDLFSSSKVMHVIGPRRAMTPGEVHTWLEAQFVRQQSEVTRSAVALVKTGELIGVCGFQKIDGKWDFGYHLRESYWGHGYATGACRCLLSHASELITGEEFQIFIAKGNTRSRKVMDRCGYIPATSGHKDGEPGWYDRTASQGEHRTSECAGDLCCGASGESGTAVILVPMHQEGVHSCKVTCTSASAQDNVRAKRRPVSSALELVLSQRLRGTYSAMGNRR